MQGMTFLGLVSLRDPPRKGVATSVNDCRSAGIKVVMVTGDQVPTARAIATKVNIITDPDMEFNVIKEREGLNEEEALE